MCACFDGKSLRNSDLLTAYSLGYDKNWIPAPVRDKFRGNDPSSLCYAAAGNLAQE